VYRRSYSNYLLVWDFLTTFFQIMVLAATHSSPDDNHTDDNHSDDEATKHDDSEHADGKRGPKYHGGRDSKNIAHGKGQSLEDRGLRAE
jgi:hypothetical protein